MHYLLFMITGFVVYPFAYGASPYDSARLRARGRGGQIEAFSEPDPDIKSRSSCIITFISS